MKTNARILFWIGLFALSIAALYTAWNVIQLGHVEWVGTVAMPLVTGLCWFPAFFLNKAAKSAPNLPEDIPTANIEDGDSEIGQFSPWSWWPILLALGCSVLMMGLALGWWLLAIGLAISVVAFIGWSFEMSRGSYGH